MCMTKNLPEGSPCESNSCGAEALLPNSCIDPDHPCACDGDGKCDTNFLPVGTGCSVTVTDGTTCDNAGTCTEDGECVTLDCKDKSCIEAPDCRENDRTCLCGSNVCCSDGSCEASYDKCPPWECPANGGPDKSGCTRNCKDYTSSCSTACRAQYGDDLLCLYDDSCRCDCEIPDSVIDNPNKQCIGLGVCPDKRGNKNCCQCLSTPLSKALPAP